MKKLLLLIICLLVKQISFSQCLNGIYTIGGASPSFTSINQAVSSLTVNGVCGPVTFNLRPGTYNEKMVIPQIVGTSSVNTITFQSENADSSSVIIQAAGASAALNYVVKLNGADYISFNKLSFINTDVNYSCVFYIINTVLNFSVSNSIIEGPVTSTTNPYNDYKYLINSVTNTNANFIIENNRIIGGQRAIYASNNVLFKYFKILNNIFLNQYQYSISLLGVSGPEISLNSINYSLANPGFTGIYLSSCSQSAKIEKNKIEQSFGNGIYIENHISNSSYYSSINNNKINISGNNYNYGLLIYGSYFNVFHNTIVSSCTNSLSSCIVFSGAGFINIKNNILYHKGSGYVFKNIPSNLISDYNDLYTEGLVFANNGVDLSFNNWKSLDYDLNSLRFKPQFVSNSDFYVLTDFSQNLQLPFIPSVPDDIDGNLRDNTSPYFGAFEFINTLNATDVGISKVLNSEKMCTGNNPIKVLLKNLGTNSISTASINWSINGAVQSPFAWAGNLNLNDTVSVAIGNLNFLNLGTYKIKAWTDLPNGISDELPQNDSAMSENIYTALNGSYNLGSSGTFTSIAQATFNLKTRGVCGNVILNMLPGTYNENLELSNILELSGANSLTIQSSSGLNTSVKIASPNTQNSLLLSNVSNVTIKNVTIGNSTVTANPVVIAGNSNNLEINGCILNGSSQIDGIILSATLSNFSINKLRILNNEFIEEYKAIELQGTSSYKFYGLKINNNKISGTAHGSILVSFADTLEFCNNEAITYIVGPNVRFYNTNYIKVLKNKIIGREATVFGADNINGGLVANNMFESSGTGVAITNFNYVNNIHFENNNISCLKTTLNSTSNAINYTNNNLTGSGNRFWNNVIQNLGAGYIINYNSNGGIPNFKNNVYYFKGLNFGAYNNNLAPHLISWKLQSNTDSASFSVDPQFTSNSDLHVHEISLNNAGLSVSDDIVDDIDGQARNNPNPDIGADEFVPLPNDAATTGFNFNSLICSGNNTIQVLLKNNGSANLTSANIICKINSTLLPTVNWTGNLSSGSQTLVTIANYNFVLNTNYLIKTWPTLPNGVTDVFKNNDTTSFSILSPALTGTFTIGGTAPTYTSITQAVNVLKASGVCGPVVYDIRDGIYTEKISISNIKGVSSINTVTFKSQSNDSTKVTIAFNSTTSGQVVLAIDSADYIIFNKIGIKPLNATYSSGVLLSYKANNVQFKNCLFTGIIANGTLLSVNSFQTCDSLLVENCKFLNSYTGIYLSGTGNVIRKNSFDNQSSKSIYNQSSNLICVSNLFTQSTYTPTAIISFSANGILIDKNKIYYNGSSSSGILISSCGTVSNPVNITNNFISVKGGTGIALTSSNYCNVFHNSVNQNGNGNCFSFNSVSNSVNQNNIYFNSIGYCVSSTSVAVGLTSNYNCIYSPLNKLFSVASTTYNSISTFNSATGLESNSVSTDPLFTTNIDLHVTNSALVNNNGLFVSSVTDDIDGELRSITNPDIGADEFVLSNIQNDVQVLSAYVSSTVCGGSQIIYAKIKNTGITNLTSVTLAASSNVYTLSPITVTCNLSQGQTKDSISIGVFPNVYGNTIVKVYSFNPNTVVDQNLINDTLIYQMPNVKLKGIYTIGGANPDFANLRLAKNALFTYGICGPITFNIRPGTYQDTLTIPSIVGSSTLNTITFQSENGDSSSVVITDFPINLTNNNTAYVLKLMNSCNINLHKLTIKESAIGNSSGSFFTYLVYIFHNLTPISGNINISNCKIEGNQYTNRLIYAYSGSSTFDLKFTAKNNSFLNGDFGVSLQGLSINSIVDLTSNRFENQNRAIDMYQLSSMQTHIINKNFIKSNRVNSTSLNLYSSKALITNNQMIQDQGSIIRAAVGSKVYIYNNFMSSKKLNTNYYAIEISNGSTNCEIINNTIRVEASNYHILNFVDQPIFKNNVVENLSSKNMFNFTSNTTYAQTLLNNRYYSYARIFVDSNYYWLNKPIYFLNDSAYKLIGDIDANGTAISYTNITTDIEENARSITNPDMGAYEFNLENNDAGIVRYVNPTDSILCTGNNSINVVLRNYGSQALSNCNINWKVNNVFQTPFNWTGNLASGDSTTVNIGSINLAGGQTNRFIVYTSDPNGTTDVSNFNDTIKTQYFKTRLSGIYTIGGNSPNYTTIKQATDSLQKFGVCGPVIYNFRDGSYSDNITINKFQGNTPQNRIVFQSENLDSSLVLISNQNYNLPTIQISCSNISFYKLSFLKNSSTIQSRVIYVTDYVKNINIKNCVFDVANINENAAISFDVKSDSLYGNYNVSNNNFKNRAQLVFIGNLVYPYIDTASVRNLVVNNNYFEKGGLSISRVDSIDVQNNTFNGLYDVKIQKSHKLINFFNNKLNENFFTIENCNGKYNTVKFYNNIFDSTKIQYISVPNFEFFHNTVNRVNNSGYSSLIEVYGGLINQKIKNNIFYNSGFGSIYGVSDQLYANPVANKNFDYNIIYSPNDTIILKYSLFLNHTNWQNLYRQDEHSLFIKPTFAGPHDFHIINDHQLNNIGTNSLTSSLDFDKVTRNTSAPDIGAYEFNGVSTTDDAGILNVVNNASNCDHTNSPLTINLKNYGVNNLTSVTIKWQLNGIAQTDFAWTGNLPAGTFTTVTIGTYTNQTGNGANNLIAFTTLPNGNSDAYVNNDSLITNLGYPMLNGIYTVGGFGADFNNLDDVINGLNQYGICGPVVFKFNPGGYVNVVASNSIIISGIHGNNSQNSITFESANGNNASAVIKGSVVLSYVKSITFKNMTFLNNSILLSDSCRSITFVGNNILRDSASVYTGNSIYSGKYVNDLKIINNTFKHIASSFIYTNFAGNSQKIIVKGNYFYNANKTALYFTAADSLVIDSNVFYNTNTSSDSYRRAIAVSMLNGRDLKISRNVVKGKFNAGIYAGMGWPYSSGICRNCFIENNSIIAGPIGSSVGLLYCSADSMNVFYNSVKSNSAGSPPLYVQGNNVKVKNNVLYAIGSQCASLTSFTNTISDYNVYYTTGATLLVSGTNSVTSLSTYSASTGNDAHSIVADPQFINLNTDLHYQNTTLNGIATPIASVLFDQQGIARNPSIPNPGAYETLPDTTIDLVNKQLILKSIDTQTLIVGTTNLIKTTIFYILPSNIDTSTYKFRGTIDSLRIHYQVNHQPEVIEKWNGTLKIGDSLKYTFTNSFFVPNGKLYDIKVWFENLNPNNVEYNSLDDSLRKEIALPMQGDYTMGGTLPDFPGLYYSNYSLQKCGTVGNVRFLMRAGHYGFFSSYNGTNTTSYTKEYRPESGSVNEVSIDMSKINDGYKLKKMTILPSSMYQEAGYGPFDGIQGKGANLDSCWINGKNYRGTYYTSGIYGAFHFLSNDIGNSATITNCRFTNLGFAFYLSTANDYYYDSQLPNKDFVFENNTIDSCDYGIIVSSFASPYWLRIKSNSINTYSTSILADGNYRSRPGNIEISGNKINSILEAGINDYNSGQIAKELIFSNNFVCGGGTLPTGNKLKIFNNSFNSKATIVCLDTSYVYNNIFYNYDTTGSTSNWSGTFYHIQALELSYVPGKIHSDNNNIYAPTAGAKAWYQTLTPTSHTVINTYTFSNVSQINTLTGLDSNSVSFTPLFVSSTDLHSQSAYMKNMGRAITTLTTDIDGDARPAGPLDIGADEIQIPFTGVWPGDANGDMQVTSQDLYSVGLHYDYHGYQRDSISNTFVGQLCNDWNLAQIGNSIDIKYADCNGDSLIDMNDTMAIHLNYNLTHIPKLNTVSTSSITDIYLSFNKSLYLPGDTVKIDIAIGKFDNIQNNFYGGGFKLLYEPDKVKPNSEKMTFINSWVGNINSTKLKFSEINHAQGLLDAAVVRTTHTTINGYGKIGTFEFVLNDIVGSDKMHINVIDGNKVYGNGVITPIMSGIDSIPIVPNNIATSVDEIISDKVSIYPNPATDFVKIDFLSKVVDCKLELISIDGKVVITDKIKSNVHILNLSGIAKGIYTLKLKDENGVSRVYKLVIQ